MARLPLQDVLRPVLFVRSSGRVQIGPCKANGEVSGLTAVEAPQELGSDRLISAVPIAFAQLHWSGQVPTGPAL